jgi:hypothetical protein
MIWSKKISDMWSLENILKVRLMLFSKKWKLEMNSALRLKWWNMACTMEFVWYKTQEAVSVHLLKSWCTPFVNYITFTFYVGESIALKGILKEIRVDRPYTHCNFNTAHLILMSYKSIFKPLLFKWSNVLTMWFLCMLKQFEPSHITSVFAERIIDPVCLHFPSAYEYCMLIKVKCKK